MSKTPDLSLQHKAVEFSRRVLNVGGICSFDADRWKEAVLCHIYRVWEGNTTRPYLDLGGVTLEYDPVRDIYFPYGKPSFAMAPHESSEPAAMIILEKPNGAPPSGGEVRDALGRFARNPKIRTLTISSRNMIVELWKTPGLDLLGVAAAGIPETRLVLVPAPAPTTEDSGIISLPAEISAAVSASASRHTSSSQNFRPRG